MLGLKRLATHSPFLNREKIVHQMHSSIEQVMQQQLANHQKLIQSECKPPENQSALAAAMRDLDFDDDPVLVDSDVEQEARKFDRKRKPPLKEPTRKSAKKTL